MVSFVFSAPQWPPGSGNRSGPWTHLRLLQHAVVQNKHQEHHQRSHPGKSRSAPMVLMSKQQIVCEAWPSSPSLLTFQTFSPSLFSSQSSPALSPPAPEKAEGGEVKGQVESEVSRLDLLKRKRRNTDEEVEEKGVDNKKSKSGELLHKPAHLTSPLLLVSEALFSDLSVQSRQRGLDLWAPALVILWTQQIWSAPFVWGETIFTARFRPKTLLHLSYPAQ